MVLVPFRSCEEERARAGKSWNEVSKSEGLGLYVGCSPTPGVLYLRLEQLVGIARSHQTHMRAAHAKMSQGALHGNESRALSTSVNWWSEKQFKTKTPATWIRGKSSPLSNSPRAGDSGAHVLNITTILKTWTWPELGCMQAFVRNPAKSCCR